MDSTTQPVQLQQSVPPTQAIPQVQQVAAPQTPVPVVPISDQPLTLDPNMLSTPAPQAQATPQVSQQPVQQPVQPTVQPQPIQAPQYPVSGPHKEAMPVRQAPVAEYVRPTEVAPVLQQEVAEAGVEVVHNPEQPQLTPEHKAVGIEHAKEAVPVTIPMQPSIQLPYTPSQVQEIEKKVPISESKHWLAVLTEYLMKKLQGVTAK